MDCSERSAGAAAGLPDDPLVEILSRVPAKSVCRFKCVSKGWRDLIADPDNRKKLPQPLQGLFYALEMSEADDPETPQYFKFGFIDLMTATSVAPDIDPCFSFLTELPGIQVLELLDSCNGLILLAHCQEAYSDALGYIVCNPATKEWQGVPTCGRPSPPFLTYLAFDPAVSSHFHLIHFEVDEDWNEFTSVQAYSSEIGTWSPNQNDQCKEQIQPEGWHHKFRPSHVCCRHWHVFVNGILHFILWDWDRQHQLIVAVDVQGKLRKEIALPDMSNVRSWSICYFDQSQGSLHYMTQEEIDDREYERSIWVLQDYDTQEWVLKCTLTYLELHGDKGCIVGMTACQVVGIHQDCNVIFFARYSSHELIAYDMDRKEASVFTTFEKLNVVTEFACYVPYFSESPALTMKHQKCVL